MENIRTAHYQYRCRLCGKVYDKCCGGENQIKNMFELINVIEKGFDNNSNVKITILDIHAYCKKGNALGIADFIGIKYTKKMNNKIITKNDKCPNCGAQDYDEIDFRTLQCSYCKTNFVDDTLLSRDTIFKTERNSIMNEAGEIICFDEGYPDIRTIEKRYTVRGE